MIWLTVRSFALLFSGNTVWPVNLCIFKGELVDYFCGKIREKNHKTEIERTKHKAKRSSKRIRKFL